MRNQFDSLFFINSGINNWPAAGNGHSKSAGMIKRGQAGDQNAGGREVGTLPGAFPAYKGG